MPLSPPLLGVSNSVSFRILLYSIGMNPKCPHCHSAENQIKAGHTKVGSQRFQCKLCQRRYTPEPKERGYPEEMRRQAIRLHADGMNMRRIARQLSVNHQCLCGQFAQRAAFAGGKRHH